ncbi:Retroviral aspartyl protease [Corchorus capsularis]|uniref:Retroviral aspartyl protease n=1 Tax=Corchorus capsularis TaxID=210143 RepID=A0A1R3H395_COCAP|nr:Retroviral aspartyl protease [Corchorus capsularis]
MSDGVQTRIQKEVTTLQKEVQRLDTTIEHTATVLRTEFRSGIDAMNTEMKKLFEPVMLKLDSSAAIRVDSPTSHGSSSATLGVVETGKLTLGSSHNFMDRATAKKIGWPIHHIAGVGVTIANGDKLWAQSICYGVQWEAQGLSQTTSFMLLPLSGCDVVLGVEWLVSLGPIL